MPPDPRTGSGRNRTRSIPDRKPPFNFPELRACKTLADLLHVRLIRITGRPGTLPEAVKPPDQLKAQ